MWPMPVVYLGRQFCEYVLEVQVEARALLTEVILISTFRSPKLNTGYLPFWYTSTDAEFTNKHLSWRWHP